MSNIFNEQRRFIRVPVRVPVSVILPGATSTELDGELLDISIGGAFVHCTAPVKIGQEVRLRIKFNETRILTARVIEEKELGLEPELPKDLRSRLEYTEQSIVRWARGSSESGFGVEFVHADKEGEKFLERFVKYCETLVKTGLAR